MAVIRDIGRLLVERGVVAEGALSRAPGGSDARLLAWLLEQNVASERVLISAIASQLGMPGVDLSRTTILKDALALIPRGVAEADLLLPLSTEGDRLHVALSALGEHESVLDELRFITGREISGYVALPGPLEQTIAAAYDALERGEPGFTAPGLLADAHGGLATVLPADEDDGEPAELIPMALLEDDLDLLEIESTDDDDSEVETLQSLSVRVGKPRVLVVDDEPEIVTLLQKSLSAAGYEVETAADGLAAEKLLAERRYDLVLLDAMLPQVHGFEVCTHIKSSPRTRALPVIMMSAVYRGWRFAQDARESFGADDYVEKPFHLRDVLERVQQRLRAGTRESTPQHEAADKACAAGMALLEERRFAEARKKLELAVQLDPFSAKSHFALARALQDQGDVYRAITSYERALELRPSLFAALRNLAALYLEKGFRRKAAETLERALAAAPDTATRDQLRTSLLRLL